MSNQFNSPGSKWWKFDFHTHTPSSDDYGRDNQNAKSIEPEIWLRKAMDAGLDCIVVTDHNSGGWIDKLKTKNQAIQNQQPKPDWLRELTIFPGVEMTVADSRSRIHLIAVFDPEKNSETITSVLGACGITKDFGSDQSTSTNIGFVETVNKITKADGIAIPAHIDSQKGLLENVNALTPELKKSLTAVFAAEFCDIHAFDDAASDLKKQVEQLAKLAGSDAHHPDDIGKHTSWLKMSSPSIEGLKLALLDHGFCVKNQPEDPNHQPDIFLSRLTIQHMKHCGRIPGKPFDLHLHPHFNVVIGGRGVGKSTVLEATRIVTRRDQQLASEAPDIKRELEKFMKLSQEKGVMLNETKISLKIHRLNIDYWLHWQFDGQGSVLEEYLDHERQTVVAGDVTDRFPVSIYSQKQINALASNPQGLLVIVDRATEVNRQEWQKRWENVKSQFLQAKERQRELQRQLSSEQQLQVKLKDVKNDLKQYEEKGHGEILKLYQKRSQQKNSLPGNQIFDELSEGILELAKYTELADFPTNLFDVDDETTAGIQSIHDQTVQDIKMMDDKLNALVETVNQLKTKREQAIESSQWYASVESSIDAYNELLKTYGEKQSHLSISLYGEWVQQQNQLQQQLNNLASIRKEAVITKSQINELQQTLVNLRKELLDKRKDFLSTVIGESKFVKMELIPFGDVSTLEQDYRSMLNLGDGVFSSSIYDENNQQGILWRIVNWEKSNDISTSDLADEIAKIKKETFDIAIVEEIANQIKFSNRLNKLYLKQPSIFDALDTWWPEDLLRVKYSKDPASGKFEDLEKGSAGQKAAAILAFLLSYGNEPLIIDQPEDDLDNALIYDLIVTQIHENKQRRQLIIVTHNPNIVVNGDAELVHVLKFENGQVQIDQQGGLEEVSIRDAICTIMEGGRIAFDRRYKRIMLEINNV